MATIGAGKAVQIILRACARRVDKARDVANPEDYSAGKVDRGFSDSLRALV